MTPRIDSLAFNSPFETGLRSLCILVAAYPAAIDLHRLVILDHIVVHTGDVGGPPSLHPKTPLRSAELLVRRGLVERGLLLMASRGLIERHASRTGINYRAGDFAEAFLSSLTSPYIEAMSEKALWVAQEFGELNDEALEARARELFSRWTEQFLPVTRIGGGRE